MEKKCLRENSDPPSTHIHMPIHGRYSELLLQEKAMELIIKFIKLHMCCHAITWGCTTWSKSDIAIILTDIAAAI